MIKKIITVVCAFALFFGCGEFLRYILIDDVDRYTRVMLHEMYTADRNIDIAFVGSSHAYRSFVPQIMDAGFGAYTFNAGSSSQLIDGSFAMIQEICTYHCPKRIFLELYYNVSLDSDFKKRTGLTSTYILSDYMRPSIRKYRFLLDASSPVHYSNSFIPARRNWKKIVDVGYIFSVVRKKQSDEYKNYQLSRKEGTAEYYVERGFVANDNIAAGNVYWRKSVYSNIPIVGLDNNDWYMTLLKIIEYCKIKGVELTFVVAPLPEWSIVGVGNYQVYYDCVKSIADEHGLEYYDFNLCNPIYFDANDNTLFKDEDHLNTHGAEKLSKVFADFFMKRIPKEDLFYDTLRQKLDAEKPNVFCLAGLTKDGKGRVVSNREQGMEYKLEVIPKKGAQRVIKAYSEEKEFIIPKDEHGKLILSWRMKGEEKETRIETEY